MFLVDAIAICGTWFKYFLVWPGEGKITLYMEKIHYISNLFILPMPSAPAESYLIFTTST